MWDLILQLKGLVQRSIWPILELLRSDQYPAGGHEQSKEGFQDLSTESPDPSFKASRWGFLQSGIPPSAEGTGKTRGNGCQGRLSITNPILTPQQLMSTFGFHLEVSIEKYSRQTDQHVLDSSYLEEL